MSSCTQAPPVIKLHFYSRPKAQLRLQYKARTISASHQLSISFPPCTWSVNTYNYSSGSVVLHWKYVAMESTARQRASNTAHRGRSSPQLLLRFAGPPLPSTQRLKIDLKLKWSICNTSFLPFPPRGTETFHKNHTKHPTYALTSPHQFLILHCTHASKRKFLTARFSFCVLFLSGKQVSLWNHLQVLFSPYYLLSHNTKQIPCASPPCCLADCQGSDFCHLKPTLAKGIEQQQSDLQIQTQFREDCLCH